MFRVEDEHWWYVALHDLIRGFVAREAGPEGGLSILDAGCGTGRLCQLLAPFGVVEGCDLSEQALDFCRQRGVTKVSRVDLSSADLGERRYDVITAIDLLYHQGIVDDASVAAGFHRALKPGGLLILNLVAFEFLRSTHDIAVHTRKRYRRRETIMMLESLGFRVETAVYRLGFLFLPIAGYRLARRFLHNGTESAHVDSDVRLPSRMTNRLLRALAMGENRILRRGVGPLGTSLFVTARKPREGELPAGVGRNHV